MGGWGGEENFREEYIDENGNLVKITSMATNTYYDENYFKYSKYDFETKPETPRLESTLNDLKIF